MNFNLEKELSIYFSELLEVLSPQLDFTFEVKAYRPPINPVTGGQYADDHQIINVRVGFHSKYTYHYISSQLEAILVGVKFVYYSRLENPLVPDEAVDDVLEARFGGL